MARSEPQKQPKNEIVIAIMGATGSGKSTFINLVSGSNLAVGNGLKSCTSIMEQSRTFELHGRRVVLLDTPGFDDTTRSDTDILTSIAVYLSTMYEAGWKLSGVIYMHRISDYRMTGIGRRNFSMFRKLCGDDTLKNVVIVTNMWGQVAQEIAIAREKELASEDILFRPTLAGGAVMLRNENTLASAQAIITYILKNHPMTLKIQKELVDEGKDISQTDAGVELNRELAELARKHREELVQVQREMKEALDAKDEQTRAELEQVRGELTASMHKIEHDREQLSSRYAAEKQLADEQMAALKKQLEAHDAERAERQAQIDRLQKMLEDSQHASAAERAELKRQLDDLKSRGHDDGGGGCVVY